jgi:peptide/nickel transport system substrate-binding protein
MIEASNYGDIVPWPIHEALKGIVSEGAASKTVYSFNTDEKLTEVDLLGEKCVADIKAKLVQYAAAKAVPACLVGFVSPGQAAEAYESAIAFIEKHGHAVISEGGFIFDKYDAANKTAVLVANRDPSYPFEKGYFAKLLATDFLRINKVSLATYKRGSALKVTVSIADVAFPSGAAKPAAAANVSVTLVGDKETRALGRIAKPGMAEALIPAAALDSLKPGSYTVIVEAAKGSEAGAVETANLVLF